MSVTLRAATAQDQQVIRQLIREGGINPMGLKWPNFVVAVAEDGTVIGCGQLKPHNGIVELASIAVTSTYRAQGIARLIIERLQSEATPPLWLMCDSRLRPLYRRFGFVEVVVSAEMPNYFARMRRLVAFIGRFMRPRATLAVMRWDSKTP